MILPPGLFDNYRDGGYVAVMTVSAGGNPGNGIDHVHPFYHLAENRVAEVAGPVVEGGVVLQVDEKLGSGAVNVLGAGQGQGAAPVFQAVVSLAASFFIGARVVFLTISGVNPPPWMTKPGMTRWKITPS